MVNYLALLGWAPKDGREIVTLDEMIAEFDIHDVNHSGAIFDIKKLEWMNGEYVRAIPTGELIARLSVEAHEKFGDDLNKELFERAVELAQPRATTTKSMIDQMVCLFDPSFSLSEEMVSQLKEMPDVERVLEAAHKHLESCEWNTEAIDLRETVTVLDLKPRKALPIIYIAIEGSTSGLPLFDAIHMVGRDEALRRIKYAQASIS